MDVSKLFEPGEIPRLSKDETMALYKRHMMAQYERAEAAVAECARLQQALKARHRWLADALSRNQIVHETDRARARAFIADWEALAGPGSEQSSLTESSSAGLPDTPATPPRPPIQPPGHQREMADTRAGSQEDKT